jgi:hypothetical protein
VAVGDEVRLAVGEGVAVSDASGVGVGVGDRFVVAVGVGEGAAGSVGVGVEVHVGDRVEVGVGVRVLVVVGVAVEAPPVIGLSADHSGSAESALLPEPSVPWRPLPELSAIVCPVPSSRCQSATVFAVADSGVVGGVKSVV